MLVVWLKVKENFQVESAISAIFILASWHDDDDVVCVNSVGQQWLVVECSRSKMAEGKTQERNTMVHFLNNSISH